jgi:hypothetical protein
MNLNKLFPNDTTLSTSSALANIVGLNEALVLQRLNYWLTRPDVGVERDGYKWVYNTYEQWHENFRFWSTITIKRIFYRLEKAGLIISAQFDKGKWDQTKYYRIDYQALEKLINQSTDIRDNNKQADDQIEGSNLSTSSVSQIEDDQIENIALITSSVSQIGGDQDQRYAQLYQDDTLAGIGLIPSLKESKNTTNNTTKTTAKNTNNASLAKASDAPSASEPPKPVVPRGVLDIFPPPDDLLPDNPPPDDLPPDDMYIFPPPDDPPPDDPPPDNPDKPAAPKLSDTAREFLRLFGAKRFKTQAQFEQFAEFERQYQPGTILDAARWASTMGMAVGGALIAMKTALKKWDQPKKAAKPMERAYGLQINEPKGYAALRQWAKEEGINDLGI